MSRTRRFLLFPVLLLVTSSCGDMRESIREKYTGERKGSPILGGRRTPVLNPAMEVRTAAPVLPVTVKQQPQNVIAPVKPASAAASPYDMYDNKGNAKSPARIEKAPEPVKAEPVKQEPQASLFERWFGNKEAKKEVAELVPERKSFRGNTEVDVAEVPEKIIPIVPGKKSESATIVASRTPKAEPVVAVAPPAPEPAPEPKNEPVVVSAPPVPAASEVEETPVPVAAEITPMRENEGNGVIIPPIPKTAIKDGNNPTPPAIKPNFRDTMAETAPAGTIKLAQQVPPAEPKPALADVPEKPKAFKAIQDTKAADQKDLAETHEKAMDEKKELAKEPTDLPKTDLPKIEDTIEEIRGALESPVPIITAQR